MDFVKANNGLYQSLENNEYWKHKYSLVINSKNEGYINYKSTEKLGYISLKLGAGRIKKEDSIDYGAGIILNIENNNFVKVGDSIATLYSNSPIDPRIEKEFYDNLEFLEKPSDTNIPKINTIIR